MMEVRALTAEDLVWSMTSMSAVNPASYRCGAGQYRRAIDVDPFPGYAHDLGLVRDLVAECEAAFPLNGGRAELCSLQHEFLGRTNGLTWEDTVWRRDDGSEWNVTITKPDGSTEDFKGQAHTIVICGKRIPIMPAMTRYLVTHEYGHAAFNHTRRLLGISESKDAELEAEYMRIRGCELPKAKGDGERWHRLASEVIANDFRCIVMRRELDFWPHEVPHPRDNGAIAGWWDAAIARTRAVQP
jgi:hypothetical protein